MNSDNYTSNWNRSFVLMPDGAPRGAVVLLHGLTDSPYSLRHIAAHYREQGFVAVAIRLPGHGTVPGRSHYRSATRTGARPPGSRCARRANSRKPGRCTSWVTRTAARWRCSTRSMRSRTTSSRPPTSSC